MALTIQNWGLIEYQKALEQQESLAKKIAHNQEPGLIVVCSHPPIVTKGRKTQAEDIFAWQGPIADVRRGGRATYHGPSQLVVYPLLNLAFEPSPHPRKDVIWVIRSLEVALVNTLKLYGLEARGKTSSGNDNSLEDTGVWIGAKKIASIGIGVVNWVSYHGIAINLDQDPNAFSGLKPCGYSPSIMTNLQSELEKPIERSPFTAHYIEALLTLVG